MNRTTLAMFALGMLFLVLSALTWGTNEATPVPPTAEYCDSLYQEMWEQRDNMPARDMVIHEAYSIGCPMEDI